VAMACPHPRLPARPAARPAASGGSSLVEGGSSLVEGVPVAAQVRSLAAPDTEETPARVDALSSLRLAEG